FHWWRRTAFLVFHLSGSSPNELCTSHCSGERQRSYSEVDWTSSRRIEQTSARSMDHRPAVANESCRNSFGNSHFWSGGHGCPHGNSGRTNASDLSLTGNGCRSTVARSCRVEG